MYALLISKFFHLGLKSFRFVASSDNRNDLVDIAKEYYLRPRGAYCTAAILSPDGVEELFSVDFGADTGVYDCIR